MHACGSHNIGTVDLLLEELWVPCVEPEEFWATGGLEEGGAVLPGLQLRASGIGAGVRVWCLGFARLQIVRAATLKHLPKRLGYKQSWRACIRRMRLTRHLVARHGTTPNIPHHNSISQLTGSSHR